MNATRQTRRLRRRQRGASAVEFALIAPVLFLLLLLALDLGISLWVNLTMQYAVREGARYAVTGRADQTPGERLNSVVAVISSQSLGYYDSICTPLSVNGTVSSAANAASVLGGAGDIIVVRVDCSWKLATPIVAAVFPNGVYKFAVAATMQNEQFYQ
jgi:Flp pilus assembly protein TadG